MKKFISGLLIGMVIVAVLPVKAAVEEYILYKSDCKLIVNGTEFKNSDLPMLNYKGYNYLPASAIKQLSEAIGGKMSYNNDTKEIILDAPTAQLAQTPTPAPSIEPSPTPQSSPTAPIEYQENGLPVGAEWIDYQGCNAIKWNDKIYISDTDLAVVFGVKYVGNAGFLKTEYGNSKGTVILDATVPGAMFNVSAEMYYNFDLFTSIIGE